MLSKPFYKVAEAPNSLSEQGAHHRRNDGEVRHGLHSARGITRAAASTALLQEALQQNDIGLSLLKTFPSGRLGVRSEDVVHVAILAHHADSVCVPVAVLPCLQLSLVAAHLKRVLLRLRIAALVVLESRFETLQRCLDSLGFASRFLPADTNFPNSTA